MAVAITAYPAFRVGKPQPLGISVVGKTFAWRFGLDSTPNGRRLSGRSCKNAGRIDTPPESDYFGSDIMAPRCCVWEVASSGGSAGSGRMHALVQYGGEGDNKPDSTGHQMSVVTPITRPLIGTAATPSSPTVRFSGLGSHHRRSSKPCLAAFHS